MQNRGEARIFGLDLSSYQTIVNADTLFSKMPNYIYLRAFGSTGIADTTFNDRVALAKAHGVPSGAYYFARPTKALGSGGEAECDSQMNQFCDLLETAYGSGQFGDLIPMLDCEAWGSTTPQHPMYDGLTGAQLIDWVKRFRDGFFARTNRRLGFYSNRYFLQDPSQMAITDTKLTEINNMPLWLAEYDTYYPNNATKENGVWKGGVFTGNFNLNKNQYGDANDGEIQIDTSLGNQVIHPDGRVFDVAIGTNALFTHLEGTSTGTYQIMYIGTDWSRFPQSNVTNTTHDFALVKYNTSTGKWQYFPNSSTGYDFTINDDDCLMGEVTKTLTTGGIASYTPYTPPSPANLGGWQSYVLWQYGVIADADQYGLTHGTNEVDHDRTDSVDRLKPPPPPTNLSAKQTGDNEITVYFTRPDVIDYLGASVYINGVWKKWLPSSGADSAAIDITAYARNTSINYQVVVEDQFSDFGKSDLHSIMVFPTKSESELNILPISSQGTVLKKGTTAIAELTSIDGISVSADTIETTTLDTVGGYRTFLNGLKDAGEVSISGHFVYASHNSMMADFESGATNSYTIEFPDKATTSGTKWTFSAIVTAFSTSADLEDLIGFEATLKVSGKPTLSAPA